MNPTKKEYKDVKRTFRKYFRQKEENWETEEYNNIKETVKVNHQKVWQYVKKNEIKRPKRAI